MSINPASRTENNQLMAERSVSPNGRLNGRSVFVRSGIEESNRRFLDTIQRTGLIVSSSDGQMTEFNPHHHIGAIQWNAGKYRKSQKDYLIETCKLCETLPRGCDEETLLAVGKNYNQLARAYQLLIDLETAGNFKIGSRECYMIRYCLAQAHASRGEGYEALTHLNRIISSIGRFDQKNGIKKQLTPEEEVSWSLAISLRAAIVARTNAPQNEMRAVITCPKMYLTFLIDSGEEFQTKGNYGFAALYYEAALKAEAISGAPKLQSMTKDSILKFLANFYLHSANEIKEKDFNLALNFYDKSLKIERRDDVVSYVLYRCEKKKSESADLKTQIKYLKVMIRWVCSYGNSDAQSRLPEWQREIFDRYVEFGINCLENWEFEQSIIAFEKALKLAEWVDQGTLLDSQVIETKRKLFEALVNQACKLDAQQDSLKAEGMMAQALRYKDDNSIQLNSDETARLNQLHGEILNRNKSDVVFETSSQPF